MSADPASHLVAEVPLRPMTPALVLYGRDEAGRPRAAWFDASEAKLAAHAAEVMGLRVFKLATDEQRDFADQFSHGRVFGSGRAFVPYVRRELFPRLLELTGVRADPVPPSPAAAKESPPAATSKVAGRTPRATAAAQPPTPPSPSPFVGKTQPQDRDEIGLGSIVLAQASPDEGWWEAEVITINDPVLALRWRDYPTEPTILRKAEELALLPLAKA